LGGTECFCGLARGFDPHGLRHQGIAVGALGITCYRPWPHDELRTALHGVPRVVVVNRAIAVGAGSVLGGDVRLTAPRTTQVHDVVMGLGGRPVTRVGLQHLVLDVLRGRLEPGALHFVDLDESVVAAELAREEEVAAP
jgi:pyruvate ferredoxin oxidoreductase alpha subunit